MKFTLRDLLLATVIMAMAGCFSSGKEKGGIQYFPPGPEFKKGQDTGRNPLPASEPPAPNLPKP